MKEFPFLGLWKSGKFVEPSQDLSHWGLSLGSLNGREGLAQSHVEKGPGKQCQPLKGEQGWVWGGRAD